MQIGKPWFKKSIEERLQLYDIKYTFVSRKKLKQKPIKKLSNVPKGYPGTLMYNNK